MVNSFRWPDICQKRKQHSRDRDGKRKTRQARHTNTRTKATHTHTHGPPMETHNRWLLFLLLLNVEWVRVFFLLQQKFQHFSADACAAQSKKNEHTLLFAVLHRGDPLEIANTTPRKPSSAEPATFGGICFDFSLRDKNTFDVLSSVSFFFCLLAGVV